MNNLMKFESQKVEVFEFNGKVLFNPYDVGRCLELTESAVRKSIRNFNDNQRIKLTQSIVTNGNNLDIPTAGRVYLTESGVYKLIFKSRKKEAERFCDWVTDEVLPTIRKTGKYETKPVHGNIINSGLMITQQKRKMYNGQPVLLRRDLEKMLGLNRNDINYLARANNIGFTMISGKELDKFKSENPNAGLNMLSNIRLYNKDDVMKVIKVLNISCDDEIINQYFYEELSDYDKLWRIEIAKELERLTYRMGKDTVYRKMICMVASKMFMDCGLLDGIYDNLDITNATGHNLMVRVHEFRKGIKVRLSI